MRKERNSIGSRLLSGDRGPMFSETVTLAEAKKRLRATLGLGADEAF